jgi:hypothetical protein
MQIVLLKPHEHAGTMRGPGETIDLADDLGQWLCKIDVAQPVAANATQPTQKSNTTQE